MHSEVFKTLRLLLVIIAVWSFGWFVWPTRWHYTDQGLRRTNRFTGTRYRYEYGRWERVGYSHYKEIDWPLTLVWWSGGILILVTGYYFIRRKIRRSKTAN